MVLSCMVVAPDQGKFLGKLVFIDEFLVRTLYVTYLTF